MPTSPSTVGVVEVRSSRCGATPTPNGVRFQLFATDVRTAAVRLFEPTSGASLRTVPLDERGAHMFEKEIEGVSAGALYKFVLDGKEVPDPYARFLPFGVHGPARVEPRKTATPSDFRAPPRNKWVISEVHVGTFTAEGTYRGAVSKLDYLADLGVNVIELMPLATFAGSRSWGYDGVALYAPHAA